MLHLNKVVLIGRLTKDPDLRFTPGQGKAVARITVAVDRRMKKEDNYDLPDDITPEDEGDIPF